MNIIGKLTVDAVENYHKTFEYAGAGELWNLDAADIDILEPADGVNYWFLGQRPGTRIDSWFQNRIGGCYGNSNRNNATIKGVVGIQFNSYDAGRLAAAGQLKLFNGWTYSHVGEYSSGQPMYRAHKIDK